MNSMKIGTYQMDTTFGLYLPEYTIPAPAVQTNFVKIIGRDGSVDLSNALGLHYDSRTWSLDFKCFDPTVNWHTLSSQVMNAIHGKRLNFEFDDDPNYFWTGRVSVQNYVSSHGTGTLKVTIVSDPFKYAKLSTIVTKTASTGTEYTGELVTFNTANAKINDLSVTMQPLQDLHGYSSPWPAGGGKNLIDFDQTVGTTTIDTSSILLQPGTYYVYVAAKSSAFNSFVQISSNGTSFSNIGTDSSVLTAYADEMMSYDRKKCILTVVSATYCRQRLQINSNVRNARIAVMYTTDSTGYSSVPVNMTYDSPEWQAVYRPYSNICPITGRTGLSVYRTGKNLLDASNCVDNIYPDGGAMKFSRAGGASVFYASVKPNTTYTLSANNGDRTIICSCDTTPASGVAIKRIIFSSSSLLIPQTFMTAADETLVALYVNRYASTKPTEIQLELGSTSTTYEPYNGNTYAVDWTSEAGTMYGGTHEVVGGALTDEWAEIPSYNGETITEPWLSSMDAYTPGATPTTGAQVVYKLATPLTYQLTPQEIEALVGTNNVWSDGGNVTVAIVTPETLTNNGRAVVPTLTASADMVLKWGNYSASVQQGTSTIPQLILENGANLIYIIGTGSISFTWQEVRL